MLRQLVNNRALHVVRSGTTEPARNREHGQVCAIMVIYVLAFSLLHVSRKSKAQIQDPVEIYSWAVFVLKVSDLKIKNIKFPVECLFLHMS